MIMNLTAEEKRFLIEAAKLYYEYEVSNADKLPEMVKLRRFTEEVIRKLKAKINEP